MIPETVKAGPALLVVFSGRAPYLSQQLAPPGGGQALEERDNLGKIVLLGVEEGRRHAEDAGQALRRAEVRGVPGTLILIDPGTRGKGIDAGADAKLLLRQAGPEAGLFQAFGDGRCFFHGAAKRVLV